MNEVMILVLLEAILGFGFIVHLVVIIRLVVIMPHCEANKALQFLKSK